MPAFILTLLRWILGFFFGREPVKPVEASKPSAGLGLGDADRM
jgi:hypothetical protein